MAKKPAVFKVQNGGCFDDLNIIVDESDTVAKSRPLDMFSQVLPALDKKNYAFYEKCSDKEKKSYAPLVIMRWMSSTSGDRDFSHHFHVLNVNDFVNTDFWSLSSHPELQHKLLCMCGTGAGQRHNWIPMIKKTKSKSKVDTLLKKFYPKLNEMELSLYKKSITDTEYEQFIRSNGYQDKEIKALMKDWKDEKKKGF